MLILAFDVQNHAFVQFQGSVLQLTDITVGVFTDTRVYLVKPSTSGNPGLPSYDVIDYTLYDGFRLGIWKNAGSNADADKLTLTDQLGWTVTADEDGHNYLAGSFITASAEIIAWLATDGSKAGFFVANLVKGADLVPVFQTKTGTANLTVRQNTDPGSGMGVIMTGAVPCIPLPCQFKLGTILFSATIPDLDNPSLSISRIS